MSSATYLIKIPNNIGGIIAAALIKEHLYTQKYPCRFQPQNLAMDLCNAVPYWDEPPFSIPGRIRAQRHHLGIDDAIILKYQEFIDIAEIIDGNCFATPAAAFDFEDTTVKIRALLQTHHHIIKKESLCYNFFNNICDNPNPEDLLDADPLYAAIIQWEAKQFYKYKNFYSKNLINNGTTSLVYNKDVKQDHFCQSLLLLPYLLNSDSHYNIQVYQQPQSQNVAVICTSNPWQTPKKSKHLGNYFTVNFSGIGNTSYAYAVLESWTNQKLKHLINFLEEE